MKRQHIASVARRLKRVVVDVAGAQQTEVAGVTLCAQAINREGGGFINVSWCY